MPAGSVPSNSMGLVARARAWWDASTFLGDVALLFTIITVGNSIMMLTGLDEPKTGSFAYLHLLGRLGIIAVIVGLFSLDEFRERCTHGRWASRPRPVRTAAHGPLRRGLETVLGSGPRGGLEGTARVYTTVVAVICVVTVALADLRPPAGGRELYRNLVLLALLLLPVVLISRWWQRRAGGGGSSSS